MEYQSVSGQILYEMLPEHYRLRDNGDLAAYLDVMGGLLDQIRSSVDALSDDFIPGGNYAQQWTLPYVAELFGVNIKSSYPAARVGEVENAIRWGKRKGTCSSVEEIAEVVGGFECEMTEGWQIIARSVIPGFRLEQAEKFNESSHDFVGQAPNKMAQHPGLPSVSMDLRKVSKAIAINSPTPDAKHSNFNGQQKVWRITNRHGVPEQQGNFADKALRTVDFRPTGSNNIGLSDPARINLFVPPFQGFFKPGMLKLTWDDKWLSQGGDPDGNIKITFLNDPTGVSNKRLLSIINVSGNSLKINSDITLRMEDAQANTPIHYQVKIQDICFCHTLTITNAHVELKRCAVPKLEVTTRRGIAEVKAKDCLFQTLQAAKASVYLDHTTVMQLTIAERLFASDCIFTDQIRRDLKVKNSDLNRIPVEGHIRYSRIPKYIDKESYVDLPSGEIFSLALNTNTHTPPRFNQTRWATAGCGVVKRASAKEIEFGAESHGVLGSFNHLYYSRRFSAMQDKLREFLPLGMQVSIVDDPTLLKIPTKK